MARQPGDRRGIVISAVVWLRSGGSPGELCIWLFDFWCFFLSVKKLGKWDTVMCGLNGTCSNDIYATTKFAHVCELCGARDPWWKHHHSYNGITCSELKRKFIVETRASISSSHSCNWSTEALDTFPQSKDINGSSIGWYPMSISLNHIVNPGWQFGYKIKCIT